MFKNVASQKIAVYAYDTAANGAKTGDAANISAQISIDGAATAPTDDVVPTELDAADAPGVYIFDMTQAETNGDLIILSAISSTGNIILDPVFIYTVTPMRGTDSANTTTPPTAEAIVDEWETQSQAAPTGFHVNVREWLDAAVLISAVAGVPRVGNAYEGGKVFVDTVGGAAGTTSYVNGTADNPVNSIASAKTIADALNIKTFEILPGSSVTLAANYDSYIFNACHATIALGGQSVNNAVFIGALISGNDDGSNATHTQYFDCVFTSSTLGQFVFTRCYISGTITLAQTGTYFMHQCFSANAGLSTIVLDFGAALGVSEVSMRDFSGGVHIHNMGNTGADQLTIEARGQVIINANCNPVNSPVIALRGAISPLTDNVVGGFVAGGGTISQDARYDTGQILSAITDDDTQIDASQLNTHTAITPATVGAAMNLAADAIKAVSYDESTAFPVKSDDSAATQLARVGADGDTLETLSDQIDGVDTKTTNLPGDPASETNVNANETKIDTLLTRLSAIRAGYLDELGPTNIPADIDTLLTRVTGAVALASVCTEARLAELDAANLPADIDTLLTRITGLIATKAEMDTAHGLLATEAKQDIIDTAVDAILADTALLDKWLKNRIAFSGALMILYDDDNTTPLLTWTLSEGSTSVSGPYNRAKAT